MKNKLVNEQYKGDLNQEFKFNEVVDPYLRVAAAEGCFGSGYNPSAKHPDDKTSVVSNISKLPDGKGGFLVAFFTSRDSSSKPGYKLIDFYSGTSPNYTYVKTAPFKCQQLEERTNPALGAITGELYKVLTTPIEQNGLGYKKYADVKGTDILDYTLVNVSEDPYLKPGGMYYEKVKGIEGFINTMAAQKRPFLMWRKNPKTGKVLDIESKQKEVLEFFENKGYKPCSIEDSEKGVYATIDLSVDYPKSFGKGYLVCKVWAEIDANKKSDCLGVIDSYYKEIMKYNMAPERNPDMRQVSVSRQLVKSCIRNYGDKMPLRDKKIQFIKDLKPRHPYFLREATDNLTNVIRESLKVAKIKNSINENIQIEDKLKSVFETASFETKEERHLFAEGILKTLVEFHKKGYSNDIIAENLEKLNVISEQDFFGAGSSALQGSIIEYIISNLLPIIGIDPNGWLGIMVVKTLGNLQISDISKLGDCEFVTGLFTKSIIEAIIAKLTEGFGGQSFGGSLLSNFVTELGEDTEFGHSIKNALGKVICPFLENMGGNILGGIGTGAKSLLGGIAKLFT